jgi:hypothetical protein
MSYNIVAISNGGGAPEQAYRKLQSAAASPEKPYGGTCMISPKSEDHNSVMEA